MFYGQCWKCGERWELGTASTCTCEPEQPQREFVGLTDEELSEVYNQADWDTVNGWGYERAIEAKLKQKNGYAEEKNNG